MPVSKTQIDRLGERLKGGVHTESDLRSLDDYRRSFGEAYEVVIQRIRQGGEFPTGRLAKSTLSIVEKLRRESIRLSQMQDIAGCRVVVADIVQQDRFVELLKTVFPGASVIDRREKPSYGYRAVHVVVQSIGKPIEIQVRSALQHLWAELSEKSSDVVDPAIKYGGGPDEWRRLLTVSSQSVASYERSEGKYFELLRTKELAVAANETIKKSIAELLNRHTPEQNVEKLRRDLEDSTRDVMLLERVSEEGREMQIRMWHEMAGLLRNATSILDDLEREKQ